MTNYKFYSALLVVSEQEILALLSLGDSPADKLKAYRASRRMFRFVKMDYNLCQTLGKCPNVF